MIVIENNGEKIQSTNYWGTEFADAGFCYLSSNAGCLRLLVPQAIEAVIPEMRTGKNAIVKPSIIHADAAFDVIFDDGTATPLAVSLGELLIDCHSLKSGPCTLAIWTEQGKQFELECTVNLTPVAAVNQPALH